MYLVAHTGNAWEGSPVFAGVLVMLNSWVRRLLCTTECFLLSSALLYGLLYTAMGFSHFRNAYCCWFKYSIACKPVGCGIASPPTMCPSSSSDNSCTLPVFGFMGSTRWMVENVFSCTMTLTFEVESHPFRSVFQFTVNSCRNASSLIALAIICCCKSGCSMNIGCSFLCHDMHHRYRYLTPIKTTQKQRL